MKILAIDPGETVGIVGLEIVGDQVLLRFPRNLTLSYFKDFLTENSSRLQVDVVVVEDYRIFASHAREHIGARLITPELIGFIEAHCRLHGIPLVRIQPNEKGRWPEARIKARHPEWASTPVGHARDALKIALVYIEKEGL